MLHYEEFRLYRFGTKMNREDVIALRWPKACLSCGVDMRSDDDAQYAILGIFHDTKDTQILLKLAGYFYMCSECSDSIDRALSISSKKIQEFATKLKKHPWNVFIVLEKDGFIKMPDGVYQEKLKEANPEAVIKSIDSPMKQLMDMLEKYQ